MEATLIKGFSINLDLTFKHMIYFAVLFRNNNNFGSERFKRLIASIIDEIPRKMPEIKSDVPDKMRLYSASGASTGVARRVRGTVFG